MQKSITLSVVFTILFVVFTNGKQGFAQTCQGDVSLSSQAEVDAFSCVEVTGFLIIEGDDITNLDGLSECGKSVAVF
jgi:hypothetical protein